MVTQYLRAVYASLLLTTGCSFWDFSDCRVTEIGECILNGRPNRVEERREAKAHIIYDMQEHLWNSNVAESFGCGYGNSRQTAIHEAWLDAHVNFEREYGRTVRRQEVTLYEKILLLPEVSEEKKYVACARVIPAYR